jgi:SAM-dependent methyltransferase
MNTFEYVGRELELFARAANWKAYWRRVLSPYVGRTVLDVGAGIGATAKLFADKPVERWCCLEPDIRLVGRLTVALAAGELPANSEIVHGVLSDLESDRRFDSILYVDVLEHIEEDEHELSEAAGRLLSGGYLAVLSPAHNWLRSHFDREIGHFRRYNRRMLRRLAPPACVLIRVDYLDCVGLLLSAGNRLLLRQSMPSSKQLAFWDRVVVPISSALDPLFRFSLGKSIVAVWRKH